MKQKTVFQTNNKKNHAEKLAFLDPTGGVDIQRYDTMKYRQFDKLTDKQLGFFWRPEEVDILKDAKDFKELTDWERHIFTSNLKRQILLDSVQGRAPAEAFGPIVSLPELENWIITWTFSETIHSRSYTHIIRNVYSNPSLVFDEMLDIREIVDCADSITVAYDDLIQQSKIFELLGPGTHTINGKKYTITPYELKKLLWKSLMSVNILEGVRFYVSFACSWAFAELKKMEGNAKIIKFIARDENVHLASTQTLLKLLPNDDPDFKKIKKETDEECIDMFMDAVKQEKAWADYLFKDGSMIGLNADLLHQYVDWIAHKRIMAAGLTSPIKVDSSNPLPWTEKWIAGSDVQVAPQETEISSYVIGGTKQDVTEETFSGFKL
ncbi:MAG: ribonucleotide-diphosphate reductase subunit beta [Euryarchaeota archaeon]|jgi:ribonucleoside-diphosphate reductase beta chain|nr:ribonucleotide-diphosphate reductase subunit beta [Euryarchaeota archaeon]